MENLKKIKRILLILMGLSIITMIYSDTGISVLMAALFTFAFFIIWIHDNILAFSNWKKCNGKKLKSDFQIFKRYADEFTRVFSRDKSEKWR